ncbi:MAG: glycoside hydrolase family 3 N-terminal domain-containing protein [Bacteroidota bacterium]
MIKRLFFLLSLLGAVLVFESCKDSTANYHDSSNSRKVSTTSNPEIQKKVTELMSKMSLEDKVGEMTQLTIDMLLEGRTFNIKEPQRFDQAKLEKALVDHRVGSILNVAGHAYPLERWHEMMDTIHQYAMKKDTKIPVLYGIDAIHGANYTLGSTLFPQQIGMAASFDRELTTEIGRITAYETAASWIPWTFSPVADLGRDRRWPRVWEGFGEDVYVTQELTKALTVGYQGEDIADPYRVAACLKHYLGYSVPLVGKDRTQALIPKRQLFEYHVPPFKAGIDAGAKTVMVCSGEVNGIPVHADKYLLTDLLRDELGFEGLLVTDWDDINYLYERHKVAKDYKDAIRISINAGIDMSMVPVDLDFPVLLAELVREGEVPMSRIDESVRRILTLKFELGLFDAPYPKDTDFSDFASAKHIATSLKAASESIVLAKNEKNLLPLSKDSRVLVTGPTANSITAMNGGWSRTWQGTDPQYNTPGKLTISEAISTLVGKSQFTYVEGTSYNEAVNINTAVAAAKKSDVVVICLGEMPYCEKPGDIDDLNLPDAQADMVNAIAKTGKPIVLVMIGGRPRIISPFADAADAIMLGFLPGHEGGKAIANLLFGDANPSAKLPLTYPRFSNSLETYDHKWTDIQNRDFSLNGFNPQWDFGHGLSYTTFKYSNIKLNQSAFALDEEIEISVDIENTGNLAGKEAVLLFVADKVASISPSVRRLRGFEKIELQPGDKRTVTFNLSPQDLSFVGIDYEWITEPGAFEVQIGGLTTNFEIID